MGRNSQGSGATLSFNIVFLSAILFIFALVFNGLPPTARAQVKPFTQIGQANFSPPYFNFVNSNHGGGVVIFDYDGDGRLDIYLPNGARDRQRDADLTLRTGPIAGPNSLYRNMGNDENGNPRFDEVAAAAGVQDSQGVGHGAVACDFDNDGLPDLYVANGTTENDGQDVANGAARGDSNDSQDAVFLNNGDGTFINITGTAFGDDINRGNSTGVACADVDNDGDLDVFVTKFADPDIFFVQRNVIFSSPNALYRNNFVESGVVTFTNITRDAKVSGNRINPDRPSRIIPMTDILSDVQEDGESYDPSQTTNSFQGSFNDYNEDGLPDLWVVNDVPGQVQLYRNDGPDPLTGIARFTEVSRNVGITGGGAWMGFAHGDFDGDGHIDTFVTNAGATALLLAAPASFPIDFAALGAPLTEPTEFGFALIPNAPFAVLPVNQLVFQQGLGELAPILFNPGFCDPRLYSKDNILCVFTEGLGIGNWYLAMHRNDFFSSGMLPDIAASVRITPSRVLPPIYLDASNIPIQVGPMVGLQPYEFGFGAISFDFDNDMDQDIYWVGDTGTRAIGSPGRLFSNDGTGDFSFTDVTAEARVWNLMDTNNPPAPLPADGTPHHGAHFDGKGVAKGDLNADGFVDFVVVNAFDPAVSPAETKVAVRDCCTAPGPEVAGPLMVFINQGNGNNWLKLKLVGTASNRDGIGAFVTVSSGRKTQVDEMRAGTSFASSHSPILHFGLGTNSEASRVEVRWPSGQVSIRTTVEANQTITITEPEPRAARVERMTVDQATGEITIKGSGFLRGARLSGTVSRSPFGGISPAFVSEQTLKLNFGPLPRGLSGTIRVTNPGTGASNEVEFTT